MSTSPLRHVGASADGNQVARWASTLSALPHVGFVLLRPDGQVEDATLTACQLFGAADPQDLRSRWNAIHDTLAPALRQSANVPRIVDVSFDLGGQTRCVRCELHELRGDRRGYLLLLQSAERVAALEGVLFLASRYQTLASLHLTTAHDFKGSLNAMSLNVELLARTLEPGASREDDAEVQQHCLRAIRQELGRLTKSIGSVLEESRVEQGQPSTCRLASVLESVLELLRGKAERQGVTTRFDILDDTIEVMGRAGEIRQAVLNLVINALEAMPQGGELSLNLTTEGPVAVMRLSDTGPGIQGDLRHRIWDLYFSTKSQGHGIGLHVARSVAHAYGGTVSLDRTDSGAQFTLRMPLAR